MPRLAYVNGAYVPHDKGAVHIEDRGFQFADGVYEVITVEQGRLVDEEGHLTRLARSLAELEMDWPMTARSLRIVMRELIRRNRVRDGIVYLQITRGSAPRDFAYPAGVAPTIVMTARRMDLHPLERTERGVSVITIPDIRWKRRDIKSVALLPQAMGKQKARTAGAFEAWQVDDDGFITEGCSSNAWIVTKDGVLVTRPASNLILNGITRQSLLRIAGELGLSYEERPFTTEEAYEAKEAFISSATTYAMPVTQINDRVVGNGRPGDLVTRLRAAYRSYATGAPRHAA